MIDRYSFVALTAADLGRQRAIRVDQLDFEKSEENRGERMPVSTIPMEGRSS